MSICVPGMNCFSNTPSNGCGCNNITFSISSPCGCSPFTIGSDFVIYTGPNLPNSSIVTNDTLTLALEKIDSAITGGSGGAVWGSITGTLSDQMDLISYLSGTYV